MKETVFEDETFNKVDYSNKSVVKGKYDNCSFINCDFSGSTFSHITFIECEFVDCDFSMSKMNNTALREVKFSSCKLLGLNFNDCNPFLFAVNFENCQLQLASFYELKLTNTVFKNCNLNEVDFAKADLTESSFDDCDLSRAIFENTILMKTDFRTAFNYAIDPEINQIKKAKFSSLSLSGLLAKYDIEIE